MPSSTPNGWPYLTLNDFVDATVEVSRDLANKLEASVTDLIATTNAASQAATGATQAANNAAAAALLAAGQVIRSAGRPDNLATVPEANRSKVTGAVPGTLFISENGPQGAWVWQKRGASAWAVVSGDTGWIDLVRWDANGSITNNGTFAPGWEPATTGIFGGRVALRRIDSRGFVGIIGAVRKLGSDSPMFNVLPTAFHPGNSVTVPVLVDTQAASTVKLRRWTLTNSAVWPGLNDGEVIGQPNSDQVQTLEYDLAHRSWPATT